MIYENGSAVLASLRKNEDLDYVYFRSTNSMDLLVACSTFFRECWLTATQTGSVYFWSIESLEPVVLIKCLRVLDLDLIRKGDRDKDLSCVLLGQVDSELTGVSVIKFQPRKGSGLKIVSNMFFAMDNPLLSRLFIDGLGESFWAIGNSTDEMLFVVSRTDEGFSGECPSWSQNEFQMDKVSFLNYIDGFLFVVTEFKSLTIFEGSYFAWNKVFFHESSREIKTVYLDNDSNLFIILTESSLAFVSFKDEQWHLQENDVSFNVKNPSIYYFHMLQMMIVSVDDAIYISDYHENPFKFKPFSFGLEKGTPEIK